MRDILELRHGDRRHDERRHRVRPMMRDRRRDDRRRRTLRGIVLGMFALALPAHISRQASIGSAEASVSVSENYRALPAPLAYDDVIDEAAELYKLDPNLLHAIILAESAFNPFAVSRAGAQGLMQLMPDLAVEFNVSDPFNPRENIFAGAAYIKSLLDRHHGNLDLALASYNAGPGNVDLYKGVPPFPETRRYIRVVRSFLKERTRKV